MTYEEDHGYELFGTNLFQEGHKAEKEERSWWVITKLDPEADGHYQKFLYFGTDENVKKSSQDLNATYRAAVDEDFE